MKKTKNIRVLLISPNIIGIRNGINRIQPGLGIMYIAAVLEQRGICVKIYDTALEGYNRQVDSFIHPDLVVIGESDDSIRDYIANFNPDIVGISVLFYNQTSQAHSIARLAKSVNSKIKVVIGGNQVNEKYSFLMKDENIDFAMIKECDIVFADFVEAYCYNRNYKEVSGLVYRTENGLKVNLDSRKIENLDMLPFPARHLVNMEKYFKIGLFHNPYSLHSRVGHVITSRGCPEKCTFCSTPRIWGNTVRFRSPESVVKEIKKMKEVYRIGEVQFEDDTLTLNIKNLFKLCDLLEPLGLVWNTVNGIRVDYHGKKAGIQEKMFKRMSESGCYQVCFGVETGNQKLLNNLLKKRLDLNFVQPAIEAAKKAGISVHIFLMVGFPGETMEEMERSIEWAGNLGADSYSVSLYTPLPGTLLFEYAKKYDYLIPGFTEDNILFAKANIKVPGFKPDEFEKQVMLWTNYLNHKLKERNQGEFKKKYKRFLDKKDTFLFRKHS